MGFGVRLLEFEPWLYDLRPIGPWRISLSLSFFICKMEMVVPSYRVIMRIKRDKACRALSAVSGVRAQES